MKDSRVVTLNTKASKFTTPATNSIQNTYKTQPYKGGKNTEDENTDNQTNNDKSDLHINKSPIKNNNNSNNNQDTVQVINMSVKATPFKVNKHSKSTEKQSNMNDIYDLSEVDLSPMKDKTEKTRKDFYGNAILKRGKKHRITFIDFIKKGNLEDVVQIKKIEDYEESFEEVQKKNSDKKSVNSNKDKKKVDTLISVTKDKVGSGNTDECSCACTVF
jgi:hypothetical protein